MRKTGVRLVLAGMVVTAFSWQAWAQQGKAIPDAKQSQLLKRHPKMDANGDGQLTREEVRTFMAGQKATRPKGEGKAGQGKGPGGLLDPARILEKHPEADTDKDGKLSPAEMRAYMKAHSDEVRAELLKRRPELDTNKDGVLSPEEFRAAREQIGPRVRLDDVIMKRYPDADADKDGKLSDEEMKAVREKHGEEIRAAILKRFPKADLNGDGQISDEEFRAVREKGPESLKADQEKPAKKADKEAKKARGEGQPEKKKKSAKQPAAEAPATEQK